MEFPRELVDSMLQNSGKRRGKKDGNVEGITTASGATETPNPADPGGGRRLRKRLAVVEPMGSCPSRLLVGMRLGFGVVSVRNGYGGFVFSSV